MKTRPFKLIASTPGDGWAEIEIQGELDLAVADRLRAALEGREEERVLVSLASCDFIDSTGIAILVEASKADGRRLVVHSPSAQVLRVLRVTGLTGNGLVFEDREQALSACAQSA